ncbi:bifunctional diaminohydroxyphosphoribosylaminopyrimidine deaminase/5-amino-6-(5-phosphoribosylamino)uracil reductase RibD [Riemerella anatipestifer]|uniref:bifunctional diaminohydroxyphosphoribosylaminopyrimidine deaminase/5-amino-6-(5-phosphoribosylamino)uracil reductase RibD n=1 Tax=Riemerella anatipestifer TaxID=34085 RepID=UPI0013733822|nr:bifunctional diaminohydroxyphosphoribosylaminopyrimidine deaminase/5-amino-6-(5-phosphoribosylamino)uracil reductase RibD [Riemerella anatipestifer]MBT0548725.1 bifunctional diaminohydroxyphosphoribosylaminopyrimidine deaminase/5-amino-6-(5-phosphoribosylamino)uracil reductase RibD [Riemerella anatipestifer]MBT0555388.1 bifunctional diaminohydroxyphosphoribosylaminopyrimidine deaminase/5-amino-6-(5-phosphoribosylamino)uracil reductase RibD [Riemerella anatipestifer]MBT0559488.1 bifunctional d
MSHEKYISRCIALAEKARGNTYPNPLVGAVIVHNGIIIGEGYHHKAGEPHAEINAINSVENKGLLKESTIYVSLEPCSHFGRTPPCATKITEIGFKKVVIGSADSNEKVSGKGKAMIEEAGIEVVDKVLEERCRWLNRRFFTFHEKKRPYIILKWAESNDGFIDRNFVPTPISNTLASQYVHKMRAEEHAILVGTQTALNDNPTLDVRHLDGRNPIRVLIDLELKVPRSFNIFNTNAPTIIFNLYKNCEQDHLKWIKIDRENFLEELMCHLYEQQIQSIIIEGGSKMLNTFIEAQLWDEAVVIKAPNLTLNNGTKAPIFNEKPYRQKQMRDNVLNFYKK